jgi:hypothetical protein
MCDALSFAQTHARTHTNTHMHTHTLTHKHTHQTQGSSSTQQEQVVDAGTGGGCWHRAVLAARLLGVLQEGKQAVAATDFEGG